MLIAYDGTAAAERALRETSELLRGRKALVVVVYKTGLVFELVELPAARAGLPPARTERPYGAFERTRLAEEFDADAILGSIARGVLTLRLPLSKAHVANRVDIREQQREPEATSLAS